MSTTSPLNLAFSKTTYVNRHDPDWRRPAQSGKRELVIGRGSRGYVALYRYAEPIDIAFVTAIRSQQEFEYKV